uniref:Uncharacterized protein n=1 Tax=Oryza brachyantha TaxID=4533 RepID=J3LL34_ORYBR
MNKTYILFGGKHSHLMLLKGRKHTDKYIPSGIFFFCPPIPLSTFYHFMLVWSK